MFSGKIYDECNKNSIHTYLLVRLFYSPIHLRIVEVESVIRTDIIISCYYYNNVSMRGYTGKRVSFFTESIVNLYLFLSVLNETSLGNTEQRQSIALSKHSWKIITITTKTCVKVIAFGVFISINYVQIKALIS